MTNNISRLPTIKDREYTRVDAKVYLCCQAYDPNHKPSTGVEVSPFLEKESDFVGLSIDAFYERVKKEAPEGKEYFLQMQQLMAMLKQYCDKDPFQRTERLFKKLDVNISGSGIAFPSDVAYHSEQLLLLSLYFPLYPFSYVAVVVEVIRSEKAEIGYEIKCQYKDISEDLQKTISTFVKEVHSNE
jgi:hypothetical protein